MAVVSGVEVKERVKEVELIEGIEKEKETCEVLKVTSKVACLCC